MFWNEKVEISHQVYLNSKLVIYLSRLVGYFPITTRKVGAKLFLQWSPCYALYSFALGTFFFSVTAWELYVVYLSNDDQPMSPTDKITQIFAHGGWMAVFALGIFVISTKVRDFLAYVKQLNDIDATIRTNHAKSERYLSAFKMVIAPIFAIMYGVNTLHMYMQTGMGLKLYVANNLGYYTMLTLATIVFYNVRHMIYSLEKRLDRLNELLEVKNRNLQKRGGERPRLPIKVLRRCRLSLANLFTDDDVLHLTKVYMQICDAAETLNAMFSSVMTIGLGIAFIQVVQPTYFFIAAVRMNTANPIANLRLSLIALFRNLTCALLVIESAYRFGLKVNATEKLVCRLFCWNISAKRRRQVKNFSLCLGLRKIEFSAWSLFTVDRFLFADMIGTVMTFMFLLLQMQEREHH